MANIAVVDVETTGLFPNRHDRVIELAIIKITTDGRILDEFDTLVNPDRDVGRTSIHGITASDVNGAPSFAEIAYAVVQRFGDVVAIAAHNLRFDRSFLQAEFRRMGSTFPEYMPLCTMHLSGGSKLKAACSEYGIEFDGRHHAALDDARAAARLLLLQLKDSTLLMDRVNCAKPPGFQLVAPTNREPFPRKGAAERASVEDSFMYRLALRVDDRVSGNSDDAAILSYYSLLDDVLQDRVISSVEESALIDLACQWGLSKTQVHSIHFDYLKNVCAVALVDGDVTDVERRDLHLVASALGFRPNDVASFIAEVAGGVDHDDSRSCDRKGTGVPDQSNKRVCFTGESSCRLDGQPMSRAKAAELAGALGMEVVDSVSKKLSVLVASDPNSLSGKAKKARQYNIPTVGDREFWESVGVSVN